LKLLAGGLSGGLSGGDLKVVAGCTDYLPGLGDRKAPRNVLDLSSVPELRGISRNEAGWSIGASATWTDIIKADLPPAFDGLKAAAREIGSIQIQNTGTVAGNLCNASPAADGVPPLLTLDARVELQSSDGRRVVKLSDFITGVRRIDLRPNELLRAIHIPNVPGPTRSCFVKLGSRTYLVISIAMVSALVLPDRAGRIEMARVAVGSCSAVAQRLGGLEAALLGLSVADLTDQPDIWSGHFDALSPISDVRGSAEYRLEAAAVLCRRAVFGALAGTRELADG
jgi:CO/xanthine dehydrogenase FAD-binding subunit